MSSPIQPQVDWALAKWIRSWNQTTDPSWKKTAPPSPATSLDAIASGVAYTETTQTRRDLICIDRTSFKFFHVAVRNPLQHLAETIDGNLPMESRCKRVFFVQTAVNALKHGPLDLSLARGPARNWTTRGSLSAASRTTPYQLSHEDD